MRTLTLAPRLGPVGGLGAAAKLVGLVDTPLDEQQRRGPPDQGGIAVEKIPVFGEQGLGGVEAIRLDEQPDRKIDQKRLSAPAGQQTLANPPGLGKALQQEIGVGDGDRESLQSPESLEARGQKQMDQDLWVIV